MGFGVLVDLSKCIGCKACVNACNHHNNLKAERQDFFVGQGDRVDTFTPPTSGGFGKSETCGDCLTKEEITPTDRELHEGTNPAAEATRTSHRPGLSANSYTAVEYHQVDTGKAEPEWVSVKRQCMHCLEPSCNAACPVGALHSTPEGAVVYDAYKCIGCRYCMMACPFAVPTYTWDRVAPYIKKCDFCHSRISAHLEDDHSQQESACANACPTGTLMFGERDTLLTEAKRRKLRWPTKYTNYIYGKNDAGGTSWLYLSPVPFAELGFPGNVGDTAYPDYISSAIDMVPIGVTGSGLALAGLYWIYKRKQELAGGPETNTEGGEDQQ